MTILAYTGNSRESYLNWTRAWKAEYKALSEQIRNLKQTRKQFIWEYRPKGTANHEVRKTIIGPNPNHNSNASYELLKLKRKATELLELRKQAKLEAAQQYLAGVAELALA